MHAARRRTALPSVILVSATLVGACGPKVPPEAVELSAAVAEGIAAMQARHEALVSAYFDLSRNRVEDFLQRRWIPEFMQAFVVQSQVLDELEQPQPFTDDQEARLREELERAGLGATQREAAIDAVRRGLGDADQGMIMLDFAAAAVEQIELQRRELMVPIDRQERQVLEALRANYAELLQMQGSVTAFVQSVRDVVVEQEAVLQRLGLLRARDALIREALELNDEMVEITGKAGRAAELIEELKRVMGRN